MTSLHWGDDSSGGNNATGGSSVEEFGGLLDSDTGTEADVADGGEGHHHGGHHGGHQGHQQQLSLGSKSAQVLEALHGKMKKTKELIRKEQANKESIVDEYLNIVTKEKPSARIKTLFEKKNQKSGQTISQLQKKLEALQTRVAEVEKHGYRAAAGSGSGGSRGTKDVLRDSARGVGHSVGQGISTIASKPKEIAHLIKNKLGSSENLSSSAGSKFYVGLDGEVTGVGGDGAGADGGAANNTTSGGGGGGSGQQRKSSGNLHQTLSDNDNDGASSKTSGSLPRGTPHSATSNSHRGQSSHGDRGGGGGAASVLEPVKADLADVRDSTQRINEVLLRLVEEFEEHKAAIVAEVGGARAQLEEERYRTERLEQQLNDLAELHQHEMLNLRAELVSSEEKIDYRLDERTADLSDLVDNTSTRILRLEQQAQQQQIISMEMVENANFKTILSKLINVLLAVLAVVLVLVSTAASCLSPFVQTASRLMVTTIAGLLAWAVYHNLEAIGELAVSVHGVLTWPWR